MRRNIFIKFINILLSKEYRFRVLSILGLYNNCEDEDYLNMMFKVTMKYSLNLDNPKTFNEKLQWLKLYDRKSEYTIMVDKYKVREYISKKIGEKYLIPLIGVWDDADEINFDKLPNQFVLKCNHNSGTGMFICKNKSNMDKNKVRLGLKTGLKQNYYLYGREWPYKNVSRKIICEKYMGDNIQDYKIFCFNGKAKYILVCSDRFIDLKETFFDTDWNVAPFKRPDIDVDVDIKKPENLGKMLELSEKLSENIPFLRVDFYEIDRKIYFGELTFYPDSGFSKFSPNEWDYKLGDMIDLSLVRKIDEK